MNSKKLWWVWKFEFIWDIHKFLEEQISRQQLTTDCLWKNYRCNRFIFWFWPVTRTRKTDFISVPCKKVSPTFDNEPQWVQPVASLSRMLENFSFLCVLTKQSFSREASSFDSHSNLHQTLCRSSTVFILFLLPLLICVLHTARDLLWKHTSHSIAGFVGRMKTSFLFASCSDISPRVSVSWRCTEYVQRIAKSILSVTYKCI